MIGDGWHDVLIGLDAHKWVTRSGCRNVLVAIHAITSGQRLLDIVELIESDPRVQVIYTKVPHSFHNNGVDGWLRKIGAVVIPWKQAIRLNFDLAIAAAYPELHRLHAPILVVPRAKGLDKHCPTSETRSVDHLGQDANQELHDGTVVPSLIAVPHIREFEALRQRCPDAAKVAVLAGDPCFDRLLASGERRYAYRDMLGVHDDHRLVVVASRWGADSLFGRSPELLDRLATELPLEKYRVAALIHPAAWFCHGFRQIRSWLTTSCAAGLQLIDPFADWRPILTAADAFIGDHGSLAMYAAASGTPTVLTDAATWKPPSTAASHGLARVAPRLDPHACLADQVESATGTYTVAQWRNTAAQVTSVPYRSAAVIRRELYRMLELAEPAEPAKFTPVPPPRRAI